VVFAQGIYKLYEDNLEYMQVFKTQMKSTAEYCCF